jgi:hypothetical protein
MDELKFVLKGLFFAILVTILMQVKIGNETLEMKSERMIHHSAVGHFLQQTAEGATLAIRKGSAAVSQFVSGTIGKSSAGSKSSDWKIETRHQRISSEPVDDRPQQEY